MSPASATAAKPLLRSRAFLFALSFAALGVLCNLAQRASTPHLRDDIWEYGIVARQLAAGAGWRTTVVHPPLLGMMRRQDGTVPVLIHGPLMPAILVPCVALFGEATLIHSMWLGALFLLLTARPLFRLLRPRWGEPTAALAAGLLPWTPLAWRALNHDQVLALGMLLATLAWEAVLGERFRPGRAGFWLGLCYLARGEALLLVPLVLGAVTQGSLAAHRPAGRDAARLLGAFAGCAIPWWIHNALATGMPLFSLSSYLLVSYWPPYHNLTALLDPNLTPQAWREAWPRLVQALPGKMASFLPHAAKAALLQPSPWSAPLTLFGWIVLARRSPRTGVTFLGSVAALTALLAATVYDTRYLALALPGICAACAAGTAALVAPIGARNRWGAAILVLALLVVSAGWSGTTRGAKPERDALEREGAALAAAFPSGEPWVLLSDVPDFASWRTGWPAVWVDARVAPRQLRASHAAAERWVGNQSRFGGTALWLRRAD